MDQYLDRREDDLPAISNKEKKLQKKRRFNFLYNINVFAKYL